MVTIMNNKKTKNRKHPLENEVFLKKCSYFLDARHLDKKTH